MQITTQFHMKRFARGLVLKQRHKVSRGKWSGTVLVADGKRGKTSHDSRAKVFRVSSAFASWVPGVA